MAEAFKVQGYATFFAGKWQGFILVTESGNSKVVRSYTQPVFLKNIQKFLMSLILH